jgi:ABC-type transport system involved in cytochrome bd biosynthesis fused ATPase/permease subunit
MPQMMMMMMVVVVIVVVVVVVVVAAAVAILITFQWNAEFFVTALCVTGSKTDVSFPAHKYVLYMNSNSAYQGTNFL